jgi:hypothetical protein
MHKIQPIFFQWGIIHFAPKQWNIWTACSSSTLQIIMNFSWLRRTIIHNLSNFFWEGMGGGCKNIYYCKPQVTIPSVCCGDRLLTVAHQTHCLTPSVKCPVHSNSSRLLTVAHQTHCLTPSVKCPVHPNSSTAPGTPTTLRTCFRRFSIFNP